MAMTVRPLIKESMAFCTSTSFSGSSEAVASSNKITGASFNMARAIYAANEEMLRMYWDIGGMLQQSQEADGWGKKTLQRLSVDLKNDYSEIKGFSVRN